MEAMRGQGGIQMLLTAEQEAQQIVSSARNNKMMRLKQAKEEAEREASAYRDSLENEHKRNFANSMGSSGNNVKRLDEETEMKMKKLKDAASSIQSDVIGMLMKHTTTVRV